MDRDKSVVVSERKKKRKDANNFGEDGLPEVQ